MVVGQHELVPSTATMTAAPGAPAPAQPFGAGIKTRILSLDAFRGFVMFLMLAEAMHLMNVRRAFPTARSGRSSPSTPRTCRGRAARSTT